MVISINLILNLNLDWLFPRQNFKPFLILPEQRRAISWWNVLQKIKVIHWSNFWRLGDGVDKGVIVSSEHKELVQKFPQLDVGLFFPSRLSHRVAFIESPTSIETISDEQLNYYRCISLVPCQAFIRYLEHFYSFLHPLT